MTKEQEALDNFLKEYLFLCEKLNTNMQEKMLLDSNSPYNILKNAFEKAPEPFQTGIDLGVIKPKKYLKWEDLKFTKERQTMKVILNGSKYKVAYFTDGITEYVDLLTEGGKFLLIGSYVDRDSHEKQFFNDLHLEVVE